LAGPGAAVWRLDPAPACQPRSPGQPVNAGLLCLVTWRTPKPGLAHIMSRYVTWSFAADWRSRLIRSRSAHRTPFNALVNHCLYQTLTSGCGPRPVLPGRRCLWVQGQQDAMAFAVVEPARCCRPDCAHASRQFPEGDVQHWWHAPGGEGAPYFRRPAVAAVCQRALRSGHRRHQPARPGRALHRRRTIPEGAEDALPPDISARPPACTSTAPASLDHSRARCLWTAAMALATGTTA
jgi:hypothetical protein